MNHRYNPSTLMCNLKDLDCKLNLVLFIKVVDLEFVIQVHIREIFRDLSE